MEEDWKNDYDSVAISAKQAAALGDCREAFKQLSVVLQKELPAGRHRAIVRTKLEEAAAFASKAISRSY